MEIRQKLYPYPVLANYSDDYVDSSFQVDIQLANDGYDVKVTLEANLSCSALDALIFEGRAVYAYHFECAQTGFRRVYESRERSLQCLLLDKEINGRLEICTFIVAKEDIPNYTSSNFHEDYVGQSFEIEEGCILAVGDTFDTDIEKVVDDLSNTPSIFTITKHPDESYQHMVVDYEQQKLIIKLPVHDYTSYKAIFGNVSMRKVLHSMTIIPALIYVLSELKQMRVEERMDYEDKIWYRTIRSVLKRSFQCTLESEEFEEYSMMDLAQKMLHNPISGAFSTLVYGMDSIGDEAP